ncbi:TspO/MBR family protein [Desulfonatronum lacustre]|uniref:TspO/MBR family protein n=1 Tax=Desulfonatronum lacustre TaxID=66849 RepID=UPI0004AD7202|nr:TspO/MBR family protein [Desulfonatronum lacustre]SMP59092.1 TspO and MBR related proteins [Desulfonatronum zhilinae]
MNSKRTQVFALLAWLAVTFVAAAVGAGASINAQSFYTQLVQPGWAPPGFVFGPVWTALYTLMGLAAWLVWREGGLKNIRAALGLYLIQLVCNALWSWLFFVWNLGLLSFLEILSLLALILATTMSFWRIKPLAGALLMPYLLWVIFAAFLNYSLWRMNPQVLG